MSVQGNDRKQAGVLFSQALAPFFPAEQTKEFEQLGGEVLQVTIRRLRARQLDTDLAWDVFQAFLVGALGFLERHGSTRIRDVRVWAHAVARNFTYRLIQDLSGSKHAPSGAVVSLEQLLEGGIEYKFPAPPDFWQNEEDVERIVLAAIRQLP